MAICITRKVIGLTSTWSRSAHQTRPRARLPMLVVLTMRRTSMAPVAATKPFRMETMSTISSPVTCTMHTEGTATITASSRSADRPQAAPRLPSRARVAPRGLLGLAGGNERRRARRRQMQSSAAAPRRSSRGVPAATCAERGVSSRTAQETRRQQRRPLQSSPSPSTAPALFIMRRRAAGREISFSRDGGSFSRDGGSFSRDGASLSRDGVSLSRDGVSLSRYGGSFSRYGGSFSRSGGSFSCDGRRRARGRSSRAREPVGRAPGRAIRLRGGVSRRRGRGRRRRLCAS